MNLLSLISIVTAVVYLMLMVHRGTAVRLDTMNLFSMLVCLCLAWWSLCDAFFYSATTEQVAWFWHHAAAPGFCGFVAVAAYYFHIMSGAAKRMRTLPIQLLYWLVPLGLIAHNLFGTTTCFAERLVLSGSGLGWTYVQSYRTPLPWIFLAYLVVYLGGSLMYLIFSEEGSRAGSHSLAWGFAILDIVAVLVGTISIFILPYFTSFLPPISSVALLIFIIGYWFELREYDMLHVELALNPGSIFETCLDAMLITDERFQILYTNDEAQRLLQLEQDRGSTLTEHFMPGSLAILEAFLASGNQRSSSLNLELNSGVSLLCSVSRTATRRKRFSVLIFSLHNIQQLKQAQDKLDFLAHYDELTTLPNRRRLGELLDEWTERYQLTGEDFLLLFLDLNDFKQINDDFGHGAGDLALKKVAKTLSDNLRTGDIAARLSGDEFILLCQLPITHSDEQAEAQVHRLLRAVDTDTFAPGIQLDASIGSCRFSQAGDVRTLLKMADERMYKEKKTHHKAQLLEEKPS